MAGTLGWSIEAPAAAEYAVLPVGVEIIKPVQKFKIRIKEEQYEICLKNMYRISARNICVKVEITISLYSGYMFSV